MEYCDLLNNVSERDSVNIDEFNSSDLYREYWLDTRNCVREIGRKHKKRVFNPFNLYDIFGSYSRDMDVDVKRYMMDEIKANIGWYSDTCQIVLNMNYSHLKTGNCSLETVMENWMLEHNKRGTFGDIIALFALSVTYRRHTLVYTRNRPFCTLRDTQRLTMKEIREKCDTLLIYLGNNVFGELHKRPYSPFLHRTVDILIVQQLRPVDRESRYDGQPLNLTNPTTLPMTDVEVISIGLPGNTTIITPLIDLCSSADDCQERIWQKTTFDLTGEDNEAVNITEDIANRPHRNSILDQEFPIQFKMGLEEGGCRADVYDSVNLNKEQTRTIGEITFPSLDLEHEMNELNKTEISQPQASTGSPVIENSHTGTLPVETSQQCPNDDQETSLYASNNTLPDETSLSPAAKLLNIELEKRDTALPGETAANGMVSDAVESDNMLNDTPQPPQSQIDDTSISPPNEFVNTIKIICSLKELCQRTVDHDNSENVLPIVNSTQIDTIATVAADKLNPNVEMTGSEQENNDSQNPRTPSLSETEPGTATSNVGTVLPGNTSTTIKPKPSTYYTVVNSTLDDVVFISKREILNKKWKVELRNLSTKDLKLLQLSTTNQRPVKPVVTQELLLDNIDDKPSKPKRKPRPRLRPSSERIAAQALVNLQRHGVCTNPIPKHTLSVVPIKNSEPSTEDNSNKGENNTLPGETSNNENTEDN